MRCFAAFQILIREPRAKPANFFRPDRGSGRTRVRERIRRQADLVARFQPYRMEKARDSCWRAFDVFGGKKQGEQTLPALSAGIQGS